MSGSWFLRDDDTLWLIPGDSAMGLRLPLDSVRGFRKKISMVAAADPSVPDLPELPKDFPYRRQVVGRRDAPLPPGYGPGQRAQKTW